ncbi:MAG: FAD-dependent oxidoreductase [Deltaproteobacteria bacterium]|nr:FAD-dependent oxidoreductase [Deltaproteobacteria bacterium]
MERFSSFEDFSTFRKLVRKKPGSDVPCLVICAGTGGQASGANDLIRIIKRHIIEEDLHDRISLRITGCLGFCEMDPFILVEPDNSFYPKLRMEDVPVVIDAAVDGRVVEDLLFVDPSGEGVLHSQDEMPFFKNQTRTILGKNQHLDPIRIVDYLQVGGYAGLEKILANPDPAWIIDEVSGAGLRGRGGAGFPTGRKWQLARAAGREGEQKYVVCNADEGDPGAYMDRSLLEGNPHAVIEGLIIAGAAIGATKGFVYVRSEYPLAIKHLVIALQQAREIGLLGEDILGSGISFDIDIIRGAGAFVCGEETALIQSIEGRMGEPRQRPPYPVQKGIWGHPTCINNVETLSNVPVIISQGAEAYRGIGVEGNHGTKIFSLVGKIRNTGLVEVPLGTTIESVVFDIGGGSPGKAELKAVQTGGPSGGCIPSSKFDLPIDYDSLARAGSIMGSGGMIVMDENTCMVDVAKYFMSFLKDESCGKCFTCRKGTQRMYELLEDITEGRGTPEHLDLLEELAHVVKDTTMCGLGQSAPNPVLSTLRYFRHEYEAHIHDKRCDAFVCKELVGAPCQSACPLGTEAWRYVAHIQRGEYEEAYRVIREPNPFPSVCARVCNHPCEDRCRAGTSGGQPVSIRALKRFVTDRVDPSTFQPARGSKISGNVPRVAVVGAGPAGLTAAHNLSLQGYAVTIFESDDRPGGMLVSGIPEYRLPRDVLEREIDALIDENVTLKCGSALGKDITLQGLFDDGFKAVFLAFGSHESRMLGVEGEDADGVHRSIDFLKAHNLRGEAMARGRVAVIGGGNSALDAARVAVRQPDVEEVTILYRRTRNEMPAFEEEIEAALEEGVKLETLVSPVGVRSGDGKLTGVECIGNTLGKRDSSGRRRPVPVEGSERVHDVDTLIVAIGEMPGSECVAKSGVVLGRSSTLEADPDTLLTAHPGVFAGGDVVTGSNTVVDAIAAGKRAAMSIDRYLRGRPLEVPAQPRLPRVLVEPVESDDDAQVTERAEPPTMPLRYRRSSFDEVEKALSVKAAACEAGRCLRCDLEFTRPASEPEEREAGGKSA